MRLKSLSTFAFLAASLFCTPLARAGLSDGRLDVYWVDTEGGAATLIVTPGGQCLLVDTGNPGTRDANRIAAALKDAGLSKIDYLVITHYHIDHIGGLTELSKLIPIGTLYDNADKNASNEKPSAAYLAAKVDKRVMITPGDIIPLKQASEVEGAKAGAKLTIQCLAARKTFIDGPAKEARDAKPNTIETIREKPIDTSDNISSVVQLISFGDFRFYDGGDLTWNAEAELVKPLNRVGTVDVYQITHHGLALSNNPVLVKALEPTVVIMNNGPQKGDEGEPNATLKATPSIKDIWQQHKNLTANAINTTPELIANMESGANDKGAYIKMSVSPDGKEYTVSIPSTKVSKTYQTVKH